MKRIHLISGPRNLSTALMYAFAHRTDTQVVDEPLYAHYLRLTGRQHPGREETLQSMDSDPSRVLSQVIFGEYTKPVLFIKGMAHHLTGINLDFLTRLDNLLLIRHPQQLIASFAQVITHPEMSDIGVARQVEILQFLQEKGQTPVVLDSGELLKDPPGILRQVCEVFQIPFQDNMLHWEPGAIPEDGVWGKYWYQNVHTSTGFRKQRERERQVPAHLLSLYEEALPLYEQLYALSLRA